MLAREWNRAAWNTWHVAGFASFSKKMPPLRKLLVREPLPRPRQTWQQQLAIAKLWVASRGGTIIHKPKETLN